MQHRSSRAPRPGPSWQRAESEPWLAALGAAQERHGRLWSLAPPRWLRRTPGRETFAWTLGSVPVVIKRMRGGEGRDAWRELLRGELPRSAARRELDNLLHLERLGIGAPQALACFEEQGAGWSAGRNGARSALVMRDLGPHRELAQLLAELCGPARERRLRSLVRLVADLHRQGCAHRDLYLDHVLELEQGGLVLVDAGRLLRARALARRWRVKDLAALALSAPAGISPRTQLRFLARYLQRTEPACAQRALRRARLAHWRAAIERKQRRLARHRPRFAFDVARQESQGA